MNPTEATMLGITGLPDAVSDVLALVRMHGEFVCANECTAPWSLSFNGPAGHFHIVERGSAWIGLDGAEPVRIEAGDFVMLPCGSGHVLSNDPAVSPTPIEAAVEHAARRGSIYRLGGGGAEETHLVCGRFSFAGVLAPKLLRILPPLIRLRDQAGQPLGWLRLMRDYLIDEIREPRPGSASMVSHLLDLLFVQALREWAAHSPTALGWLSGLADPQVGHALSAMHEAPSSAWTVQDLAQLAGMSRSAFAARFTDIVGVTPLKYLSMWRLDLAADQLRAGDESIAEIAELVGYGSESSLTRAFRAEFNTTPAAFRRGDGPLRREVGSGQRSGFGGGFLPSRKPLRQRDISTLPSEKGSSLMKAWAASACTRACARRGCRRLKGRERGAEQLRSAEIDIALYVMWQTNRRNRQRQFCGQPLAPLEPMFSHRLTHRLLNLALGGLEGPPRRGAAESKEGRYGKGQRRKEHRTTLR
jgi:AraC-like DNA-binding protein